MRLMTPWRANVQPDRAEHWSQRGLCRDYPRYWTDVERLADISYALGVCRQCPVQGQCDRDARARIGTTTVYRTVVAGGRYYDDHGRPDPAPGDGDA